MCREMMEGNIRYDLMEPGLDLGIWGSHGIEHIWMDPYIRRFLGGYDTMMSCMKYHLWTILGTELLFFSLLVYKLIGSFLVVTSIYLSLSRPLYLLDGLEWIGFNDK